MSQYTIDFTPKAVKDYKDAVDWYENQKEGLGFSFSLQLTETLEIITERPHTCRYLQENVRFRKLKSFPYLVLFKIEDSKSFIGVFAILHEKRHPSIWKKRLKEL